MQPVLVAQLLALLTAANGTPVVVKKIFGTRLAYPIDGHRRLGDRRPVFGSSKTIRGVLLSVVATAACAPLLGLAWQVGTVVGSVAMFGDLCASFVKRRLTLPAGSRATGLDQVPESLFPLLACAHTLSLTAVDIALAVSIFFVGEILLSRVLYRLKLRDRPY